MSESKEKTPKTPKVNPLKVLSALYGIEGTKVIDIADKVRLGRKVSNKLAGEDPCPRVAKNLVIKGEYKGNPVEKIFEEGDIIAF